MVLGFWFSDFILGVMFHFYLPAVLVLLHTFLIALLVSPVSPVFPPLCVSVGVVPSLSLFVVCFPHISPVLFPVSPVFLVCSPVSSPCRVLSAFAA